MTYSIVYSSQTGNTKRLADTIRAALPPEEGSYFGEPDAAALTTERIYVGFWTNRGTCDSATADFLETVRDGEVFLFGTAGFGGAPAYFEEILQNVSKHLHAGVRVAGTYMCQGRMPPAVRQRYEKLLEGPNPAPNLREMIENFDEALSHPNDADLERLKAAVQTG